MKSELDKFIDELEKIFQTLFGLISKNSKVRKKLNKTKLSKKKKKNCNQKNKLFLDLINGNF